MNSLMLLVYYIWILLGKVLREIWLGLDEIILLL